MDLLSVLHTVVELIRAIDAYSTSPKSLAASLKTLKDELISTQELLLELEELVKEESSDTRTSPSYSTAANYGQSDSTLRSKIGRAHV